MPCVRPKVCPLFTSRVRFWARPTVKEGGRNVKVFLLDTQTLTFQMLLPLPQMFFLKNFSFERTVYQSGQPVALSYFCTCAFVLSSFFFYPTCVYCVCLLQVDQQLWLIAAIKCRRLIAQHLQPVMINIFPGSHRWVGHDIVWWLMTPPPTQALKSLFIDVFARFAPFWPHNNTPTTDNIRII